MSIQLRLLESKEWFEKAMYYSFRKFNTWCLQWRYSNLGEPFINEDWDILVLLDGCRPEYLFECDLPDGDQSTRYSTGGESWEFMQANFVGRELHDTVYVTANPHAYKIPDGTFHFTRNLLETDWDVDLGTVPPASVTEAAIDAVVEFPQKRLIVHYMQPHYPFIGEIGKSIDESAITPGEPGENAYGGPDLWKRLQSRGQEVNKHDVLDAYRENHEIVAAEFPRLLTELSGKVVITADHANLIGDRAWPIPVRIYGHPSNTPHPNLRRVPWLEITNGPRPSIKVDEPIANNQERDIDDDTVKKQLQALGYV